MKNLNVRLYLMVALVIVGLASCGVKQQPPSLKIGSVLLKGQAVKGSLVTYDEKDKAQFVKIKTADTTTSANMNKGVGFLL